MNTQATARTKPNLRTKSIIMVMLGTFSSRILGFGRNAIIAFYFGAGAQADVLNFIQAIPTLLRRLAAEGSLETALVPELTRSRDRDPSLQDSKEIWRKLLAIQWSIIFPLCLVLVIFPKAIISILSDFPDAKQVLMATRMVYFVSPYIFLLSQTVVLGALLSSQQRFTLSSFAPLLSSISIIAATFFLQSWYGQYAVLLGMIGGISLQLILLLPPIWHAGYSFLPDFRLRNAAIMRICQIWLPLWISTSILALMQFVANYLASTASSGSISALTNALIFFQLPQGLIYASIAKVCLPQMSQSSQHSGSQVTQVLCYGIGQLGILMLPATLIFFLMSELLVAAAFQRGAFDLSATLLTAEVLRYYMLGTLPIALFRFLQQYLYARSQKFQPLLQTILVAVIDIPLSLLLIYTTVLGVLALPIANTISYFIVSIYTFWTAMKHSGSLQEAKLLLQFLPKLLLVLLVIIVVHLNLQYIEQALFSKVILAPNQYLQSLLFPAQSLAQSQIWWWSSGGSLQNFIVVASHGLILLSTFFVLCRLLRIPILHKTV